MQFSVTTETVEKNRKMVQQLCDTFENNDPGIQKNINLKKMTTRCVFAKKY